MFTHLYLQTRDLIPISGTNGMSLRCSMEMKTPSEKCSVLNGVFLQAIARHTLFFPTNNTSTKDNGRKVGFVSAGVESQMDGGLKLAANLEDIELPEESDSEDDETVEIAQKDVPAAVFGGLVRKREETEEDGEEMRPQLLKIKMVTTISAPLRE
ncbi:hypothetical protein F0562_018438 [Nyssa sinensis]|uniref:Uncharacterized protein n=1 Tax=Nyssa sinensis TaxID=561372 RepID=A0A5J4ZC25_9ASTE|nr:hypothetical protein F0562_018438 [Nyssa sinensis]